jgi:hypothetical protein
VLQRVWLCDSAEQWCYKIDDGYKHRRCRFPHSTAVSAHQLYRAALYYPHMQEDLPPGTSPSGTPPPVAPTPLYRTPLFIGGVAATLLIVSGAAAAWNYRTRTTGQSESAVPVASSTEATSNAPVPYTHGAISAAPYTAPDVPIATTTAQDFDLNEVQNIAEIEKAYGFTFSPEERAKLAENKFVIKNLMDTSLGKMNNYSLSVGENTREFAALYEQLVGPDDYMARTQANSIFFTADSAMNLFSILSVELMKQAENEHLIPMVTDITKTLYNDAVAALAQATSDDDRHDLTVVRNYLAVPYALLSTSITRESPQAYWNSGAVRDATPEEAFTADDAQADSYDKVAAFVDTLKLDEASRAAVRADLKNIYDAPAREIPAIFGNSYGKISNAISLAVPFSQFTVRGSYTLSSLRRQYFRAAQWYQQVAFFLKDDGLTGYAVRLAELMQKDPELQTKYQDINDILSQLTGPSDDLDLSDYVAAVATLGERARDPDALRTFLKERKPPSQIKAMPAIYPEVGVTTVDEVLDATRGMRFFSQKFIPDSYWTGKLTQGDEAPSVQGKRLPSMASSLEVMSILGSGAAHTALPLLPFYSTYKDAIDIRLGELTDEANAWDDTYWRSNQVTGVLWTLRGLFSWYNMHRDTLPRFMQSPLWDTKSLLTSSGFWTELRHTNILYAKQSFAEKGGGGDDTCDTRPVPPPAKGYVEPQPEVYARLAYVATQLKDVYASRNMKFSNLDKLDTFIDYVNTLREYSTLELADTYVPEATTTVTTTMWNGSPCTRNTIVDTPENKRWEELRLHLVSLLRQALPLPVEGPIVPIKDKRAALIADVHTAYGATYLEEGTGVPRVIFVAVKDANGPRLTVGFTYSHYEFTSNERLTDEKWQQNFYQDDGDDYHITYKPKTTWPDLPIWYRDLLGSQ